MYSFPLEEQELILKKAMANLYCEGMVLHGAFYLTTCRLVFIGYLLDGPRKYMEEVLLVHISNIKVEKTFFIIPNVLLITTIKDKKLKIVISERDKWLIAVSQQIAILG